MKKIFVFCSLLFAVGFPVVRTDANGGSTCAGCAILLGLGVHLAQVHSTDIVTAIDKFLCDKLSSPLNYACKRLLDEFGPILIDQIYHQQTPDMICHNLSLCKQDPGKDYCHIFPLPPSFNKTAPIVRPSRTSRLIDSYRDKSSSKQEAFESALCSLPEIKYICDAINRFDEGHLPLQDKDGDRFSIHSTFRGSHWRGKDCDDENKDFYPGRKPIKDDAHTDSNCNGIFGIDPNTRIPFEELYCSKTPHKGIAILGDSAGAHFHIPPEYFMAGSYNEETFKDILMILSNEFDWPQLSSVTGHLSNQWPVSINGPIDSLYMQMLDHNRCIHRDFQNIAVNGGRSGNMHDIMLGLARNKTLDYPMVVVLALVGNDVCNGHVDTLERMTTPEEYRTNMVETLDYLNTTLPKNSTVVISGLADGRILWDTMSQRIHPLGSLNSDVKYEDLYSYLNCLEISPCRGWMNKNATMRNLTSQRAAELSDVGKNIVDTMKYSNFNLIFTNFDIITMMKEWEKQGGSDWEVIEPVDGFHPSQVGQYLSAQFLHEVLSTNRTDIFGAKNPNNQKITEIFGDQGGY